MRKDIRHHVGQLAIVGFHGCALPVELRALAREFDLGGVILFRRNVEAPEQLAELSHEIQQLCPEWPAWVSVDQEGGRVARLGTPFTCWPPMITLGRSGDDALARRFAAALARELSAVGITLDYAPVLDVHTNPENPVIGDRALSERAEDVARLGGAIIETLQAHGVAACAKHFPGHGDTSADSHEELPIVEHPPERLRDVELAPFRAAVGRGVAAIMTAHVLYPALDDERPATLSRRIVTGWLREELGYSGLIVTDDLDMAAIAGRWRAEDASVQALAAGCDLVLACGSDASRHAAMLEAIIHAAEAGAIPPAGLDDALKRQRRAKERFLARVREARPRPTRWREDIGRSDHAAVAEEMARFL